MIFGQPISPQIAPYFSFGCQTEPTTTPIELKICVRSILEVLNTLPQKKTRISQVEPPRAAPNVGHFWRKKGPKCYLNSCVCPQACINIAFCCCKRFLVPLAKFVPKSTFWEGVERALSVLNELSPNRGKPDIFVFFSGR